MERERIQSSNLYSTGHDETGMEVQFHKKGAGCTSTQCNCDGGDVFHYPGVPAEMHEALRDSPSPGTYLNRHIKQAKTPDLEPKYPARKL